ncbi:MAG: cytochrome c oxidase assembly protein [Pseudomonadota bacterium]
MIASDEQVRSSNSKTIGKLVLVATLMFGFGFALIPLYDKFCEITGLGGRTADQAVTITGQLDVDPDRSVRVHFDSNINSQLPWDFEPAETFMTVTPGQMYETYYVARNRSNVPVVAQAVPSVAPGQAALYFNKTECFCFTEQLLMPGEAKEMPVRFFVDGDLPDKVDLITLSYIIYRNEDATEVAQLQP